MFSVVVVRHSGKIVDELTLKIFKSMDIFVSIERFGIIIKITISSNLIGSLNTLFFFNLTARSFIGQCPLTNAVIGHLLSDN